MCLLFKREFLQDRRRFGVAGERPFLLSLIPGFVPLFGRLQTSDRHVASDMHVDPAADSALQIPGDGWGAFSHLREPLFPAGRMPLLCFCEPQENFLPLRVSFRAGKLPVEMRTVFLCPPVLLECSYDFRVRYRRMIVHSRSPSAVGGKDKRSCC